MKISATEILSLKVFGCENNIDRVFFIVITLLGVTPMILVLLDCG